MKRRGVEVLHGTTDAQGQYNALQVPPGRYTLTVEVRGFQRTVLTAIQLTVVQRSELPVTMHVGGVDTTVTVIATGEALNRSDATVSTLISPSDVENLPLPNREITNLIALAPGVVHGGAATR